MDFKDILRGFFGFKPRMNQPEYPPMEDVDRFSGRLPEPGQKQNNNNRKPDSDDRITFGPPPDFVFKDMLSSMEGIFREMEESMKDVESFFEGLDLDLGGDDEQDLFFGNRKLPNNIIDVGDPPPLPPPKSTGENVRDLVLKDEKSGIGTAKSKIDKDLDELFAKSGLNLADLDLPAIRPPPPKSPAPDNSDILIPPRPTPSFSSIERVYSSYSFTNGKWEGKTIRENNEGTQITTTSRNEKGETNEITEFIPSNNNTSPKDFNQTLPLDGIQQRSNAFDFFGRLFRPRL